jgi:protein-S-isoprenylcysteine O-methyltransferase Ste14
VRIDLQPIPTFVFFSVMVSWLIFAGIFIFRKKPPKAPERRRDRASFLGIVLQGLAYAMVWSIRRPYFSPFLPIPRALEIVLALALAAGSVWAVLAAVRALGKQWSFAARLVEEHKLVTEGPYALVRNPIYTGMLGMLVATGLALSRPAGLVVALVLFGVGTFVRVRSEEKLLREAFGAQFEVYARRVPAVFPRFY